MEQTCQYTQAQEIHIRIHKQGNIIEIYIQSSSGQAARGRGDVVDLE